MVFNRDRAVFAIVQPDDVAPPAVRGLRIADIAAALVGVAPPDPDFADDMDRVRQSPAGSSPSALHKRRLIGPSSPTSSAS